MGGGNATKDAMRLNIDAANKWSFFQAKNVRRNEFPLAADNLELDVPRARRRQEFEELRVRHGACHPDGALAAENALRGAWTLACERGRLRVSVTLAPTLPPRVQALETTSMPALGEGMRHAVERLAGLTAHRG